MIEEFGGRVNVLNLNRGECNDTISPRRSSQCAHTPYGPRVYPGSRRTLRGGAYTPDRTDPGIGGPQQ